MRRLTIVAVCTASWCIVASSAMGCRMYGPYGGYVETKESPAKRYNARGVAKFNEGDLHVAQANFELAVQHDDDFARAWQNLGLVRLRLREFDAALAAFERALELKPKLYSAHTGTVKASMATKDFTRARRHLHTLIGLRRDTFVYRKYLAYIDFLTGDYEAAKKKASVLIEERPNQPLMHLVRGWCRTQPGEVGGAKQDLTIALHHRATSYHAGIRLTEIHLWLGEYDKAWVRARKLLHQDANDVTLQLFAGRLRLIQGYWAAAKEHAERANELSSEPNECADAILEHVREKSRHDACPEGRAIPPPISEVTSTSI